MIDNEVMAQRMREQMKLREISQRELHDKVQIISVSVLSNLMNGRPARDIAVYQRVADELGVSSGYLVGEHDDIHGPALTGKRPCRMCGIEISGDKLECDECMSLHYGPRLPQLDRKKIPIGKGMIGTMREASRIEREARKRGLTYGKYAPIYDGGKRK